MVAVGAHQSEKLLALLLGHAVEREPQVLLSLLYGVPNLFSGDSTAYHVVARVARGPTYGLDNEGTLVDDEGARAQTAGGKHAHSFLAGGPDTACGHEKAGERLGEARLGEEGVPGLDVEHSFGGTILRGSSGGNGGEDDEAVGALVRESYVFPRDAYRAIGVIAFTWSCVM